MWLQLATVCPPAAIAQHRRRRRQGTATTTPAHHACNRRAFALLAPSGVAQRRAGGALCARAMLCASMRSAAAHTRLASEPRSKGSLQSHVIESQIPATAQDSWSRVGSSSSVICFPVACAALFLQSSLILRCSCAARAGDPRGARLCAPRFRDRRHSAGQRRRDGARAGTATSSDRSGAPSCPAPRRTCSCSILTGAAGAWRGLLTAEPSQRPLELPRPRTVRPGAPLPPFVTPINPNY